MKEMRVMRTNTIQGTYGSRQTPCDIFTYETRQGTWYACEGSVNINCTHEEMRDGVDVETLADHDTMTASAPVNSEDDLEREVDE
jgi:hypothetical protein